MRATIDPIEQGMTDMHYFPTKTSCPNRNMLATMTKEQAADWASRAVSDCMEVSRLAEIETFFNLSRAETNALHAAAIDARFATTN
jgi:uncharacterized protein YcaQ